MMHKFTILLMKTLFALGSGSALAAMGSNSAATKNNSTQSGKHEMKKHKSQGTAQTGDQQKKMQQQ